MKKIIILLCSLLLLSGCTKSNIVKPEGTLTPDFKIKEDLTIDWDQVNADMQDAFVENADYPLSEEVEMIVEEDEKVVYLMVTVSDKTTSEEAVSYATAVVKTFNDCVATQDFSYAVSDDTSFGGYFDKNSAWIQVMPRSTKDDESTWLVDDVVVAGLHEKIIANEK